MKKPQLNVGLFTVFSTTILMSNLGWANPYTGLDINFNETPPRQYEYCDKVVVNNPKFTDAAKLRALQACQYGLDDAKRMAERFGGGNGNIEGYLRGYAYGMKNNYESAMNDTRSYQEGIVAIDSISSFVEDGLDEGRTQGNEEGKDDGSSDARVRFTNAVDTGTFPSKNISPKSRAYSPVANAYERFVPSSQRAPRDINDIIKKRDEKELSQLTLRNFPVYSQYDATTWGQVTRLSWYDLWFDNGMYRFSKDRYYDSRLALQVWLNRPIDTRPRYEDLKNFSVYEVQELAPAPRQVKNPDGTTTTVQDPAPAPKRVDLQSVFQESFRQSYAYYVNYYFANEFKKALPLGQLHGEAVGTQLGKRVAFGKGIAAQFDKKFYDSALQTYRESYVNGYQSGFNSTFDLYASSSRLEIMEISPRTSFQVIGQDDDGIIQPGELIGVRFKVRNIGGVGTNINAKLAGDIIGSDEMEDTIPALATKVFTTKMPFAKIDPRMESGNDAGLELKVNGMRVKGNLFVTRMLRLTAVESPVVSSRTGQIAITLQGKNVSTQTTPATVSAELRVNNKVVSEANIGKTKAGDEFKIDLKISNIDPLILIDSTYEVKVVLRMGETDIESRTVKISSSNPNKDLVDYFAEVINARGTIPNGIAKTDRQDALLKLIIARNRQELETKKKGDNVWGKNPESTIPGMLLTNKKVQENSPEALKTYDVLARRLNEDQDVLPGKWSFSFKRGDYEEILEQLTIDGDI